MRAARTLLLSFVLGAMVAGLLTGCAEPKVRGALLEQPRWKVTRLVIDTSRAHHGVMADTWRNVERGGFEEAAPRIFSTYGVDARIAKLEGEARTLVRNADDYVLAVTYQSGFSGSYGNGAHFNLDLSDASGRRVWAGRTFVSGSGSIMTQNLGEVVANNMAKALADDELISRPAARTLPAPQVARAPTDSPSTSATGLTSEQLAAFDEFKAMPHPKAFVVGDGGVHFSATGKQDEQPPSRRALNTCEDQKAANCRLYSDGVRVFDSPAPIIQGPATAAAPVSAGGTRPVLRGPARAAWEDFQSRPYTRIFVVAQDGSWNAVWGRKTSIDAAVEEAMSNCRRQGRVGCKVYAINEEVVWSRPIAGAN